MSRFTSCRASFHFAAIAVCTLGGSAMASPNLLVNPNLDDTSVSTQVLATPTDWLMTSTRSSTGAFNDGASSEAFCNVAAAGGTGVFFKAFSGTLANPTNATPANLVTTSLSQGQASAPGTAYTFTGYAGSGAGYIGLTDPTVKSEFHLIFLDATSNVLADNVLNLVTNGLGNPANPNLGFGFNYKQFSVSGVAPAGTTTVEVEALQANAYGNPAGGDQAFVVDAMSLSVTTPEPATMACALGVMAVTGRRRLARRHA